MSGLSGEREPRIPPEKPLCPQVLKGGEAAKPKLNINVTY